MLGFRLKVNSLVHGIYWPIYTILRRKVCMIKNVNDVRKLKVKRKSKISWSHQDGLVGFWVKKFWRWKQVLVKRGAASKWPCLVTKMIKDPWQNQLFDGWGENKLLSKKMSIDQRTSAKRDLHFSNQVLEDKFGINFIQIIIISSTQKVTWIKIIISPKCIQTGP